MTKLFPGEMKASHLNTVYAIQPGTAFTSQLNNSTWHCLYQKTKSLTTAGMSTVSYVIKCQRGHTRSMSMCCSNFDWCTTLADEIPSRAVDEFSSAIKAVIRDVSFDNNVIVSVFETNITVLG